MRTLACILLVAGMTAAEVDTTVPANPPPAAAGESDYQKPDDKAMLGVTMTPPSSSTQSKNGTDADTGVEISNVYPGTAAEKMGLQTGDLIMEVNGSTIASMTDLRNEVALTGVGGQVDLVVLRDGVPVTSSSTLGEWPKSIPYEPIDAAAERRFRDWQSRRLDRSQQAVAALSKQLEGIERAVNKPDSLRQKQAIAPGSLTPLAAAAMPISEALPGLPAWKLRLWSAHTAKPILGVTAPTYHPVAWDARVLLGTPAPEIF